MAAVVAAPAARLVALPAMIVAIVAFTVAIVHERRMQRHRQPGVGYAAVTFRRDGGWRRKDLFTDDGLALQARAAKWGMIGAVALVVALIVVTISGLT